MDGKVYINHIREGKGIETPNQLPENYLFAPINTKEKNGAIQML